MQIPQIRDVALREQIQNSTQPKEKAETQQQGMTVSLSGMIHNTARALRYFNNVPEQYEFSEDWQNETFDMALYEHQPALYAYIQEEFLSNLKILHRAYLDGNGEQGLKAFFGVYQLKDEPLEYDVYEQE
jgi:hypothetical protein